MRLTRKLFLTASLAAVALMSAASLASAGHLSISNTNFRVVWTSLEFLESGGAGITCPVTLEGSFHSATIAKTIGLLIGAITRAIVGSRSCREPLRFFAAEAWAYNGTEVALGGTLRTTLPWHVTYEGFEGTLPSISAVRLLLVGLRFAVSITSKSCLATYGSATENVLGRAVLGAGGVVESITPEPNASLRQTQETRNANCPEPGIFRGTSTVTLLGNTSRITVTLI